MSISDAAWLLAVLAGFALGERLVRSAQRRGRRHLIAFHSICALVGCIGFALLLPEWYAWPYLVVAGIGNALGAWHAWVYGIEEARR
jgi:cyanate permease